MKQRGATDEEIVLVMRHLQTVDLGKVFKDPDVNRWMIVGVGPKDQQPGAVFTVGSFDEAFICAADLVREYQKRLPPHT